ncbi:KilA-N domain-containing protein [Fibrisoma limi]|nr:KilA-N domain-containing protein [Fibrisoma limi]
MLVHLNNSEVSVRQDSGGLVSLTDLWKAMGSPSKKSPNDWQNREATEELIDTLCGILNTPKMGVLKSKRGRHDGGTWAHKNLALSYAKWLNPELHIAVNQAFLERLEEETNPELALTRGQERAVRGWQKQGKDDRWIEQRIKSVSQRKAFASTLGKHGVRREGFRNCTNATYMPLYGGTSEVVRHKKGLEKSENIRDHMNELELAAVNLSEKIAQHTIEHNNLWGNAECETACLSAARSVAKALKESGVRSQSSTQTILSKS